jgi:hypothetical protein
VGEPELSAAVRDRDLTVVEMAGEDQVVGVGPEAVEDVREVAQQDSEVGLGIDVPLGPCLAPAVRARVDPDYLHAAAAHLQRPRLVGEQRRRLELRERSRRGERVAAQRVVVVAQHGVAARKARHEASQLVLRSWPREQVAADADEVGIARRRPLDRALDGLRAARRHTKVEVRKVDDAKPFELGRQPRQADLERPKPNPARLEPAPRDRGKRCEPTGGNEPAGVHVSHWSGVCGVEPGFARAQPNGDGPTR